MLSAQSWLPAQSAARLEFEVASVKLNASGDPDITFKVESGRRFVATNIPLKQLIRAAYTLQLFQIVGAPAWVEAERFDVAALADRDISQAAAWTPGGKFLPVQLMLQSLLAERFQMVARNDTREMPVYALVIENPARGPGRGLRVAAPAECAPSCGMGIGAGTLSARTMPLPQLAEFLSQLTGRVTTDATGLSGAFDVDLRWNPDLQAPETNDSPSIFTALREQLGLRLESRRGPVPVLVIDSIQRPTAN
jgi:uncharacterized protein (TIGR03435 family)